MKGKKGFAKGHKKVGGIKKGTKHNFSLVIDGFLKVFADREKNKDTKLSTWAKSNPDKFYEIVAKFVPKEMILSGDKDNPIPVKYVIEDAKKSK